MELRTITDSDDLVRQCYAYYSDLRREMDQWFFKITDYADELLDFSGVVEWPERIRSMQTNWIGRSEGVEISFDISDYGLAETEIKACLLYTSPSPRDRTRSRMPSSA